MRVLLERCAIEASTKETTTAAKVLIAPNAAIVCWLAAETCSSEFNIGLN
jgi:hypothetical protein